MLFILMTFVVVLFALLLSAAFMLYLVNSLNKQENYYRARADRDELRFVEILRAQAERERDFLRESRDRDEAFTDRLLERRNIEPINPKPVIPVPLKVDWTETDHNLFASWREEELFRSRELNQPTPSEEQLEKLYVLQYGKVRPMECMM